MVEEAAAVAGQADGLVALVAPADGPVAPADALEVDSYAGAKSAHSASKK